MKVGELEKHVISMSGHFNFCLIACVIIVGPGKLNFPCVDKFHPIYLVLVGKREIGGMDDGTL